MNTNNNVKTHETKTVGTFKEGNVVARVPLLWYAAGTSSAKPSQIVEGEIEDERGSNEVDEVLVSDIECRTCSGPVCGTCSEHGDQEVATKKGNRIFCSEWNFERGRECRIVLVLKCESCGDEEEVV